MLETGLSVGESMDTVWFAMLQLPYDRLRV